MTDPKICQAAEACLAMAARGNRPFPEVTAFVKLLRDAPDWTDAEIIEVQTIVIRALMKQIEDRDQ